MALIPKVLIVSDLQKTSPLWGSSVTQGLHIILETNPARALQHWTETLPDLVVLDIELEPLAIELIAKFRDEAIVPVLLLSSSCSDKFILDVYQAGVDEYIHKPILPPVFHAKLKAWLRHSWSVPARVLEPLKVDHVKLIPAERSILFDGHDPIRLTNLELRLLYTLMGRAGYTLTTEELCQRIWGGSRSEDVIGLKNVVYRLRRKIEADPTRPNYLLTVSGVGYQFKVK